MAKSLKTPTSVWTAVFRGIVRQLENDPDIKRVIGLVNLRSWKGVAGDKAPFVPTSSAPVARLTPQPRNVDWYSADSQLGYLHVDVELAVQTLCIDDVADLWDIVVNAIRPGARNATGGPFTQDLVAVGAETGEIVFNDPAFLADIKGDEGFFFATGQFRLRIPRSN
jgi:hypothetical protein